MENIINENIDEQKVWQRVYGEPEADSSMRVYGSIPMPVVYVDEDASTLESLMAKKKNCVALYSAFLGRGVPMRDLRPIKSLANAEKEHVKKLDTAAFIQTGDMLPPGKTKKPDGKTALCILRELYLEEEALAAAFERASYDATPRYLKITYARIAKEDAEHAEALRKIIEKSLFDGGGPAR